MNIMDFMNGINKATNAENSFSNKIAKRTEEKEIEIFAERIVDDVLRSINCKFEYINRGLSYGAEAKISEEDSKELTEKLKAQLKEIPGKLKTEIDSIFGVASTEEKKEDNKEEDKEKSSVETTENAAVQTVAEVPTVSVSPFGY